MRFFFFFFLHIKNKNSQTRYISKERQKENVIEHYYIIFIKKNKKYIL